MLKTIIGKLEKKKKRKKRKKTLKLERLQRFFFFFPSSFELRMFTQNPKTELKRLWVGLNSGTK